MGFTVNITEMFRCGFQLGWDKGSRSTSLTFVTSVFMYQLCLQVGFSQGRNMDVTNNWGHSSSLTPKKKIEGILSHNNPKMSWAFHRSKCHCTNSCGQGNATCWLAELCATWNNHVLSGKSTFTSRVWNGLLPNYPATHKRKGGTRCWRKN